jgi:hypothetical protein
MVERGEPAPWTEPYPTRATWHGYQDECQMVFEGASNKSQTYSWLIRFLEVVE